MPHLPCLSSRSRRLALIVGLLAAGPAAAQTIDGTALSRARIALPESVRFEAQLLDVSKADAPAVVLGRHFFWTGRQPPYAFLIPYDRNDIRPGHRYVVRAEVRSDERLWLTTDTAYPVRGDGSDAPVDVQLVPTR